MSTPFSNLKRIHRVPLPGFGSSFDGPLSALYRNPNHTEDGNKMLDEIATGMAMTKLKSQESKTNNAGHSGHLNDASKMKLKTSAPTDNELMTLMVARISEMEEKIRSQEKDIVFKDRKIKQMEDKLKTSQKPEAVSNNSKIQELEAMCLQLQTQVQDMEEFLADYGLMWVGNSADDDGENTKYSSDYSLWHPEQTLVSPSFKMEYDRVIDVIGDLNIIAGEGVSKIQHTIDGARLKTTEPVQLTLFANGILMFNGPFRPFSDSSTQQCMQDIMDGFFPSELQERFPDGVPFKVTDKRNVLFKDRRHQQIFPGMGQTLAGAEVPAKGGIMGFHEEGPSTSLQETSQLPGSKLSVVKFLNRLPKSVIKNGKVIDIRNAVGNVFKDNADPSRNTSLETEAARKRNETGFSETSQKIATLRITSETGDETYIVKMKFCETVGDLRKYIDGYRPADSLDYQIVVAFPYQILDHTEATIEECDLTPTANLHLQVKKTEPLGSLK